MKLPWTLIKAAKITCFVATTLFKNATYWKIAVNN
jgi:hypothetical protein